MGAVPTGQGKACVRTTGNRGAPVPACASPTLTAPTLTRCWKGGCGGRRGPEPGCWRCCPRCCRAPPRPGCPPRRSCSLRAGEGERGLQRRPRTPPPAAPLTGGPVLLAGTAAATAVTAAAAAAATGLGAGGPGLGGAGPAGGRGGHGLGVGGGGARAVARGRAGLGAQRTGRCCRGGGPVVAGGGAQSRGGGRGAGRVAGRHGGGLRVLAAVDRLGAVFGWRLRGERGEGQGPRASRGASLPHPSWGRGGLKGLERLPQHLCFQH